ncbi:hypothetical protein DERP_001322 [Dermatophagoides pteronyssinus]|uniref:Uncharacterized protein n=1 Tax=Dermatophagoides pteronyssinus TaxID=6956 RepID=A0ABQ8JEL8_DERPT|nr:hypothetical protein DERP_001322 [Dermatophagoides pteronyssinus]
MESWIICNEYVCVSEGNTPSSANHCSICNFLNAFNVDLKYPNSSRIKGHSVAHVPCLLIDPIGMNDGRNNSSTAFSVITTVPAGTSIPPDVPIRNNVTFVHLA